MFWLAVMIAFLPSGGEIPAYKTYVTEGECVKSLIEAGRVAYLDGIGLSGRCLPYDGANEDLVALKEIGQLLLERRAQGK